MKHINHVSKTLPVGAYVPPTTIFGIRSWTDIIVVIGLAAEKFLDWIFGGYIIPQDLRG
jgi:hypothetical protein